MDLIIDKISIMISQKAKIEDMELFCYGLKALIYKIIFLLVLMIVSFYLTGTFRIYIFFTIPFFI